MYCLTKDSHWLEIRLLISTKAKRLHTTGCDCTELSPAQEKKVAVIISQPFSYGKLFQQSKGKALPAWAADIDCKSWAQFFLKFIVAHPAVTCVIPGTGNPTHILDNIAAGFGKLPDEKQQAMMIKAIA